MKFTLKRKELKALARFASKQDIRFYLMGVCVTQDCRGTIIEATNGHMLGRLRLNSEPHETPKRVIIKLSDIDQLKGTKKTADDWLHFTVDGVKIDVIGPDASMTLTALEGTFPDTDRVTPKILRDEDAKPASFNPEYLLAFMQAAEDLTGKKQTPRVFHQGNNAALVALPAVDEFVGVIMPMREDSYGGTLPQWFQAETVNPHSFETA
jgi:DNA polymerase III sliding clamp (beta) subunit (PCNA family)